MKRFRPQNIVRTASGLLLAVLLLAMPATPALAAPLAPPANAGGSGQTLVLTQQERDYLAGLGTVSVCVNPSAPPYEWLSQTGEWGGISADLLAIIARRAGIRLEVVSSASVEESIRRCQDGLCLLVSGLGQGEGEDAGLLLTEAYFTDEGAVVTREDGSYVDDLGSLGHATVALPIGSAALLALRDEYPDLRLLITASVPRALRSVEERQSDLTVLPMAQAAYEIRQQNLLYLKIAGSVSDYAHKLRIGVSADEPMLRDILNRAIHSLGQQEVQQVVNRHIAIEVVHAWADGKLALRLGAAFLVLAGLVLLWVRQLRRFSRTLAVRQGELDRLSARLRQDAAALERSERALQASEQQYRLLFENAVEAILVVRDGRVQLCNPMCSQISGYPLGDLQDMPISRLIHPDDLATVEENHRRRLAGEDFGGYLIRVRRRDGAYRQVEVNGIVIPYQGTNAVFNFLVDVTERHRAEEALQRRAFHDELTGLPNRHFFEEALARVDRPECLPLTVAFGDANGLKEINDTLGHQAGDELLRRAAAVLTSVCRAEDVVVRWGGDELVVLLPHTDEAGAAALMADLDRRCAREKIGESAMSIAFGWHTKHRPEEPLNEVFRAAEEHMYRRKADAT